MLTRLRIAGFKNLRSVDLSFGPLTCVAGPNGVGKSNLFDAITFISALADKPFIEAARSVRGGDDLRSLFSNPDGGAIDIRVEMLVPPTGMDDFGQPAEASATFLHYELRLVLDNQQTDAPAARIRLEHEALGYIPKGDAAKQLPFHHSRQWRDTVVKASARRTSFIETDADPVRGTVVRLQSDRMQEKGKSHRGGGRATGFAAASLPRTVLSSAQNADETRTAVLVRNEMRSWRIIQLEPSSLRSVDDFESKSSLDASGRHIPATLARLAGSNEKQGEILYTMLANSLMSLVENVLSVRVERDEARRALRFMMRDQSGLELPASSLSDGTMRFVALATIALDPEASGLLCLEEPENGIHPQRIASMLSLLYSISCDAEAPVSRDNPLRQIIISTHSNEVVRDVHFADVVFAVPRVHSADRQFWRGVSFLGLSGSWRNSMDRDGISQGEALAYIKGVPAIPNSLARRESVGWHYRSQLALDFDSEPG